MRAYARVNIDNNSSKTHAPNTRVHTRPTHALHSSIHYRLLLGLTKLNVSHTVLQLLELPVFNTASLHVAGLNASTLLVLDCRCVDSILNQQLPVETLNTLAFLVLEKNFLN